MRLSEDQRLTVHAAVRAAQALPGLIVRVDALYADIQREIDARRPRCDASGRCCQFDKFGHLLFVTTLELAAFDMRRPANGRVDGDGCRYQVDGLCSAHAVRPFGCRVFFCDPAAEGWQQQQYETFHLRLKRMHDDLGVAYFYVEWRQGLRALSTLA